MLFHFFLKIIFNLIFQVMLVIWWKVMGKPQAIVSFLIVYRIPSFVKYLPGVQWKLIGSHWTEKMVLWYPAQSPTQSLSRIQFPSPDLGRIITEIICQEAYVSTNMTTKVRKRLTQSPFYSAPSFFAVFRNLVREIRFEKSASSNLVQEKWFCKLGFFFWFKKGGRPKKKSEWLQIKWLLGYTTLFYSNSISTKFQ